MGRRDFALAADGGKIYVNLTSPAYTTSTSQSLPPDSVLSDDFRLRGCWEFTGSRGQIGVVLSQPLIPSHITIDHIPSPFALDPGQAPRHMVLWGVVDGTENRKLYLRLLQDSADLPTPERSRPPIDRGLTFVPLASFEYDLHGTSHVQTFPIYPKLADYPMDFGLVVLEVHGNWGSSTTCLYRLRLHGTCCFSIPLVLSIDVD